MCKEWPVLLSTGIVRDSNASQQDCQTRKLPLYHKQKVSISRISQATKISTFLIVMLFLHSVLHRKLVILAPSGAHLAITERSAC